MGRIMTSHPTVRRIIAAIALAAAGLSTGCAAVSNPVADGIPVRRLPAEVLGKSKADMQPIDLTLLRRKEPDPYRLDKGDLLAIVAADLFGPENAPIPVNPPDINNREASSGYPVPVRDDGTISLPGQNENIKPLDVRGKTLREVEDDIKKMIVNAGQFKEGKFKVSVQLARRRQYRVYVQREDTQQIPFSGAGGVGAIFQNKKGNGVTVYLDEGRNDVLNALNLAGGPPGLDAKNDLIIQRGTFDPANPKKNITRIPLRMYPEDQLQISETDITLRDGDIVLIEASQTEFYSTGGVITARQWPLPRDYDLTVLQALAISNAPIVNGGFTQNAFVAQAFSTGLGTPSPALCTVLRQLPNGQQLNIRVDLDRALRDPRENIRILAGDFLIMQERPGDAVLRYLTQTIRINTVTETIRNSTTLQTVTGTNP
jgi:protein involved in polysaccharide export with SLBB domain